MRRVALKGLLGRKTRAILTALAIVLGVAMISGTYVLTDTIKSAFDQIFSDSLQSICGVLSRLKRRLQVRKNFCGHRFFSIDNRACGKAVDSNRDQCVTFEDVQHCHAGLVRAENGFVAKTVDSRRFAAVGGENGKHRGGEPGFASVEDVEYERLIALYRIITPFRIIIPVGAILVAALGVFDWHAQNFLGIGLGDDL